ncbi:MAG: hypothetical protein RL190_1289 [Actinomycetota bacterium]
MQPLDARIPGPALMGIVNVTPDSFSDGGLHLDPEVAIVDVGGESTRPGSEGVDADEELRRVVDVVRGIRAASDVPISIDTSKAAVAEAALAAGATMVNDVTAGRADPRLLDVARDADADLCLMHMLGEPRTMQDDPRYDDVVAEVGAFLRERVEAAVARGVDPARICVDPGIGFGKTVDHNLALIAAGDALARAAGCPLVVGLSRKRFLGTLIGDPERDRTTASVVAGIAALGRGAWMLRVHDVAPHRDALRVLQAVAGSGTMPA